MCAMLSSPFLLYCLFSLVVFPVLTSCSHSDCKKSISVFCNPPLQQKFDIDFIARAQFLSVFNKNCKRAQSRIIWITYAALKISGAITQGPYKKTANHLNHQLILDSEKFSLSRKNINRECICCRWPSETVIKDTISGHSKT